MKIGSVELLNIDCMEYLKTVPDKHFELAIVDPPYRDENKPTKDMRANGSMKSFEKSCCTNCIVLMMTCDRHKTVFKHQCPECLHERSREEKAEQKAAEKAEKTLKKAKLKQQQPRPKPKQISDKQSKRMSEYMKVRDKFLNGRWCAYHGHGCIPTEVHHGAGKIGDLLIDTRYFVAVCREAHRMIEESPQWAKEQGYSFERTNK